MRQNSIGRIAKQQQMTEAELLIEMFKKHNTMSDVARELQVNQSTVSVAVMRAGLKCKTVLVPRSQPLGNES